LAKRGGEDVALSHLEDKSPAWTILRPSVIVGNGRDIFSPVGAKVGNVLVCPSASHKTLRLIHVEDVGEVITLLIRNDSTCGRLFNLSHPDSLTLRDYVDEYIRASGYRNIRVIYIPYWLASLGVMAIITLRKLTGKGPNMSMRRLACLYRNVGVSSSALTEQTGWQAREGILERLKKEAE